MTTLYNVFVTGIASDKKDQVDAIRENTAQMFKLQGKELDALLDSKTETCIRRKASEAEAKKYQKTVSKLGLVCTIKQIKTKTSLSLEEIEKPVEQDDIFSCPTCKFSKPLNGKPKPLVCESCGAKVLLEEKKLKEINEKEEIKQRILQSQQYRTQLEQKEAQKEAERTRKILLEETVKKELGLNGEQQNEKKLLRANIIVPALVSLCLVAFLLTYQASNQENAVDAEIANLDEFEAMESATSSETEMADALEAVDNDSEAFEQQNTDMQNNQIASSAESQNFQQATTQVDHETMESAAPSQGAMADTFAKAEATLNAFGLSTDNIKNVSSGQSSSKQENAQQATLEEFETLESASTSQATMAETYKNANANLNASTTVSNSVNTKSFTNKVAILNTDSEQLQGTENTLPILLGQLYGEFKNDFEWNNYLSEKTDNLIRNKKLSDAYQLAINIGNLETHIKTIGKIALHLKARGKDEFARKLITQLQEKLKQSKNPQPEYYAQIALYETKIEGHSALFTTAQGLEQTLNSPIKQAFSKGKIALYQKQAGLSKEAAQNFLEAKQLANKVQKPSEKIQALLALSKNYSAIGNSENSEIEFSYALSLIGQEKSLEARSSLYCHAVNTLLANNQNQQALELISKIDLPEYQAIALTSIASKSRSSDLVEPIIDKIQSAKSPVNQAIIASTSARRLYNSGLVSNTSELFDIADRNISHINSKADKDKVLTIIARNYSLSGQQEKGNSYSQQISNSQHKNLVRTGINRLGNLVKKIS